MWGATLSDGLISYKQTSGQKFNVNLEKINMKCGIDLKLQKITQQSKIIC